MSEEKGVGLPEEFDTDPWVASFVCDLYEMWGIPVSGSLCKTRGEKIQFLWATMGLSNAMRLEEPLWRAMRGRVKPKLAAEEFARRYFEKRGKMIIEDTPVFLKKTASLLGDKKALPGIKEEKSGSS